MQAGGGSTTGAGSSRILVVDDDDDIRQALAELLRDEGHTVDEAADGAEALQHLEHGELPDAIILDLRMPVMDGWQFRVEQRSRPSLADIPVLALTADSTPQAFAVSADVQLRKPVDPSLLLSALRSALHARDRRRDEASLAQADRLASLGTFAASLAHEIKNPLTQALGNLRALRGRLGGVPAADIELLNSAIEGADHIAKIVADLGRLSGPVALAAREAVEVETAIRAAVRLTRLEVETRARLVETYGPAPVVLANASHLVQLFVNLLINAGQAIPEGRPEDHTIGVVVSTTPRGRALIAVSDTGRGIAPELRGRIFDPFFTTKPPGSGTGLGLSICHAIVTELGGSIAVESEVGRGTTFRVALPPRTAEASRPSVAVEPAATPAAGAARLRVLVIDDEPRLGQTIKIMLRSDFDVSVATTVEQAIDVLGSAVELDVILCDLQLRGGSGALVYEAVVRLRPALADRIVFMTGGAVTPEARKLLASSVQPWLDKPFREEDLRAALRRAASQAPKSA